MQAWYAAEELAAGKKGGNGKGDCAARHGVESGKATIENLLLAAHRIQRDDLDG
jgi:hypothetical protein